MPKTVGSIPYLYHLHNVSKCSNFSSPILLGLCGAMFHTIWPLYLPSLSENEISDDGARGLSEALKVNQSLRELE